MIKEFKAFALKGNVIDLAVGVIIGGAFGKIVSSLVNDVLMPVLGILVGGVDFTGLKYVIRAAEGDAAEVAILYGSFMQAVVDFLIIALSLFVIIKLISMRKRSEPEAAPAPAEPPPPAPEVVLLEEIRDLLKAQQEG
jgi:large conductance mechanosensitive channel